MFCHALNARANYTTYTLKKGRFEKTIILYDDHRCILNVLNEFRKTYKSTLLSYGFSGDYQVPNLIFFDRHDDSRELNDILIDKSKNLDKNNEREFWSFVEFDATPLDDNWVCLAMELNLVNNVVLFGNKECDNISRMKKIQKPGYKIDDSKASRLYIDGNGGKHELFSFSDCFDLDCVLEKSNPRIDGIVRDVDCNGYVLDFDLDCFSDGNVCWKKKEMEKFCLLKRLNELVELSSLITICREPRFCGGLYQSNKILEYLDKYLFDGCMGACRKLDT